VSEKVDNSNSIPTPSPPNFQNSSPFPLHGVGMERNFSGLHRNGVEIKENSSQILSIAIILNFLFFSSILQF
jgi:hypothetical protein